MALAWHGNLVSPSRAQAPSPSDYELVRSLASDVRDLVRLQYSGRPWPTPIIVLYVGRDPCDATITDGEADAIDARTRRYWDSFSDISVRRRGQMSFALTTFFDTYRRQDTREARKSWDTPAHVIVWIAGRREGDESRKVQFVLVNPHTWVTRHSPEMTLAAGGGSRPCAATGWAVQVQINEGAPAMAGDPCASDDPPFTCHLKR